MSQDINASYQWATWLDSMEGVPEWPQPAESAAERAGRGSLRHGCHEAFGWVGTVLPGLGLAMALALVGDHAARWLGTDLFGFSKSPVSGISVAIVLGLAIRNTIGLPAVYERGLRLCARTVLRFGIVLLGLRLSLETLGQIGLAGLPVILACIASALVVVAVVNRALGLPARLGSLIAVGTSICGISAIAATAPVVEAEEDEVSYAVACVTLFGLLALFTYPILAHQLFGDDPRRAGLFLGIAIHDTAQAAGAGLMYQEQFHAPEALDAATVAKLVRNVCMAAVVPLVGIFYHRRRQAEGGPAGRPRVRWHQMVPLFVIGFVAAAAVRSVGDLGSRPFLLMEPKSWSDLLSSANDASTWCLTVAMAAVGLGTGLAKLRELGVKPFCVGLAAAAVVGGVGAGLITLLGPWI